jgi:hypothetical protein
MIILLDTAMIKPKNVLSVYVTTEKESRFLLFYRKKYHLNIDYISLDGSRGRLVTEYASKEAAIKELESAVDQVKAQLAEDHYLSKLFEEALERADK